MNIIEKELRKLSRVLPDRIYLQIMYYHFFHRLINFDDPITYNEKLNWLKLYDRNNTYTTIVDKCEGKKYVEELIGEEYIIPTLGVWNRFDDIQIESLPEQFVLKTTHDSHGIVLCKDKAVFNVEAAKATLSRNLSRNMYWYAREWPYKNVKPRIIAEEFIGGNKVPDDYKFFMFDGKMDAVLVCTDRENGHPVFRFYDKNWNRLWYQHEDKEPIDDVPEPINYQLMIKLAETLSVGFAHIRVDLYNINGKIYFGELTLYDAAGFDTDISFETDLKWGRLIDLKKIDY